MRHYLHIDLADHKVRVEEVRGADIARAGRYLIARKLLEQGVAQTEPLAAENPLIFSAGPLAGTNFSNANRTSVGCKSPLTGGIKESNAGGTLSVALGQQLLSGFTLDNAGSDWVVIHIADRGKRVTFDDASPYMGKGNFAAAKMLHERYGKKTSLAICGPVGEYLGLLAGIAVSDKDRRPTRMAARGGVGAVMGSKKVKAIVIDLDKMPPLHERAKVIGAVREYADKLANDPVIDAYGKLGTAMMADLQNYLGGLPVRNFSGGRLVEPGGVLKMGGDYIREQNIARGGDPTHACMPGCLIRCSNVYVDENGAEIASPIEYETLGLLGTNCGIEDPDQLARLNAIANDLGIDTIEAGAMIGVLMEAGVGSFGDYDFIVDVLEQIRRGTEQGKLWAQGTARVGTHYGVTRVPVIKKQAISAYDPRVVEVTGVSMMVTAQGADHTAGNVPRMDTKDKGLDEIVDASLVSQVYSAVADSVGMCIFGRTVTNTNLQLLTDAINHAHGLEMTPDFFEQMGRDTIKMEWEFNTAAGFTDEDDDLPGFFYDEPLPPSGRVSRFRGAEVRQSLRDKVDGKLADVKF